MELPRKGEIVSFDEIEKICRYYGLQDLWNKINKDPPPVPFKCNHLPEIIDSWVGGSLYPAYFLHALKYWAGYPGEDDERSVADEELKTDIVKLGGEVWLANAVLAAIVIGGAEAFGTSFVWGYARESQKDSYRILASSPKTGEYEPIEKIKIFKAKPPKRYFTSHLEGGPEAAGSNPQLIIGKSYKCVFGLKAEPDPKGVAEEILSNDLAKMRNREAQVLAVGTGVEIRNGCLTLKISQDCTSAESAVSFKPVQLGLCNLKLMLLLDRNLVRTIRYDFLAVRHPAAIFDAPFEQKEFDWPTPEECHNLRKQELHIMVSGGLEELVLHFVWGAASAETLPLKLAVRRDLEIRKQKFLSTYARSMAHTATTQLKPKASKDFLADLKELGEDIFRTLFILPARSGLQKAGEDMRLLLRSAYPAPIQIFPGQQHLPWMFLSDGEGALGLRHGVEYILPGTLGLGVNLDLTRNPLRLVCGLAPVFESEKLEDGRSVLEPLRQSLTNLNSDRIEVHLSEDETQWLQDLRSPADVITAYCHGTAGNGSQCLWMTQRAKAIPASMIDSNPEIDWSHNPLVILAACSSGAIDPFRAIGLANSFMSRGSRGYIAADGELPTNFASLFMECFFDEFFKKGGKPLGTVLCDLRRQFLEKGVKTIDA